MSETLVKMTSSPEPSPTGLDLSKVQPGAGFAVVFTLLALATAVLLWSLNRHLKRISPQLGETDDDAHTT